MDCVQDLSEWRNVRLFGSFNMKSFLDEYHKMVISPCL